MVYYYKKMIYIFFFFGGSQFTMCEIVVMLCKGWILTNVNHSVAFYYIEHSYRCGYNRKIFQIYISKLKNYLHQPIYKCVNLYCYYSNHVYLYNYYSYTNIFKKYYIYIYIYTHTHINRENNK